MFRIRESFLPWHKRRIVTVNQRLTIVIKQRMIKVRIRVWIHLVVKVLLEMIFIQSYFTVTSICGFICLYFILFIIILLAEGF